MLAKVEQQPLATIEDAKEYLLGSFRQFQSIVGSAEKSKRYFGIAIHCLEQNPQLLECPRTSFRNSLVEAARLDLEPNSVQQLCWIIGRRQEKGGRPIARLEVGYRGLAQLVMRDGAVKSVWAMAVDEKDEFLREEGTKRVLVHNQRNHFSDGSVDSMVAAYACAKLHNDEVMYRVMDREELEAARKLSRSSAYNGPFAMEMYLKTPLKRLCKTLPLRSPDVARVVAETVHLEDELEDTAPAPEEGLGTPEPYPTTKDQRQGAAAADALEADPRVGANSVMRGEEPQKETVLPQETREELDARIGRTWQYLDELEDTPELQQHPMEYYAGEECDTGTKREFADYLAREMLKAERRAREKPKDT